MFARLALMGTVAFAVVPAADAATVQFFDLPDARVMNPLAIATTGDVRENKTRTWPLFGNPWPGATNKPADAPNAWFTGIGRNASATYAFDLSGGASFVWGTPDYYNKIEFLLGDGVVDTFALKAGDIVAPAVHRTGAALAVFSNIIGGVFDGIRFSSTQYSFEIANLTTTPPAPIPLPAGGALLLTAIGGLAVARRRKRAAAQA